MNSSPLIDSAIEILRQGEMLLQTLDEDHYTRLLPAVFTSAIGGHYRHCLDHFQCLLDGVAEGEVNYDHRRRDTRIENDRAFAFAETRRLREACARIPVAALELPLNVCSKVSYEGETPLVSSSSYGRELMYAVAHESRHVLESRARGCSLDGVGHQIPDSHRLHLQVGIESMEARPVPAATRGRCAGSAAQPLANRIPSVQT